MSRKYYFGFILLIILSALLYFNWTSWHGLVVGILGLVLYYSVTTIVWGDVVGRILPLNRAWARIFGFLASFYLSAMAIGIPVVVWKYDRLSVVIAMLAVGLVGIVLSFFLRHPERSESREAGRTQSKDISSLYPSTPSAFAKATADFARDDGGNWRFVLLGFLSALFIYYLAQTRTGAYIFSPWDILPSFALMLFFAIAFLAARLVFSKRQSGLVLAVIIIFSFVAHLYLPMVYETGFGGDKWRHLGAERWLQEGKIYTPSVWGEPKRSVVNFGPVAVPEALVAGNKTSYAPQWAVTIMLSESLGVDVFWVDLLLVFLLWSFFLPLILFQFGRLIFAPSSPPPSPQAGEGTRLGLLFAFLPALFYTFQSEGAITIPVSFGHLFFFFILLLWAYYIKSGQRAALFSASLLSLAFYWGYILNFFVLISAGILAVAFRKLFLQKFSFSGQRLKMRDAILFGGLVVVSALVIPFLEVWQGLSHYVPGAITGHGILDSLANAFGQMSGWIGTVAPPDFIDQGNFLYNQTKESLSRLPLLSYRIIPFIISLGVWIIISWGIYKLIRFYRHPDRAQQGERRDLNIYPRDPSTPSAPQDAGPDSARDDAFKTLYFLAIIFFIALASYFISWSFTEGVHVLARRLNETIVFFMILFLGWGLWLWLWNEKSRIRPRKKILALCFILAFAATSTFASGPKLQLVTADELKAAELVWSELKDEREPYCVIANTWPLLGLEAESARRIIAGGFPLYNEYAQPERVKIFEMLSKKPALLWFEGAFRITGAEVCYYMNEKRWLSDFVFNDTIELLGEPKQVGTVYIWRVENRRTAVAVYK